MAEMIPDRAPSKASEGEKRLFAALRQLDSDCIIYYEPVIRQRNPDFILILPGHGLLVIEVKGWWPAHIRRAAADEMTVLDRGRETIVPHPARQARDYMFRLMDECKRHPYAASLLHGGGRYGNRFVFPFGHCAVLSNISRKQLNARPELARVFPPGRAVTRDQLEEWSESSGAALLARVAAFFDPVWRFPRLDAGQIAVLRSVIHPEVVIDADDMNVKVLDLRQERCALSLGEGHRVIQGVAGSGKTVILIARARLLAEDGSRRILVLCYNRVLSEYLAAALRDRPNVDVLNFHRWAARNGAAFERQETDAQLGARLLAHLDLARLESGGAAGAYDAVLIDEAQDFAASWFHCAKLALKEPDDGDLIIACDASQSLRPKRRPFTWTSAGVHAQGRTIIEKFDLERNYRNTAEILSAAHSFAARPRSGGQAGEDAITPVAVDPRLCLRSGPPVLVRRLASRAEECDYAARLVETLLKRGAKVHGATAPVTANDIAILYPRLAEQDRPAMEQLRDALNAFTRCVALAGDRTRGALRDEGVKICTIKSAKGLQFRAVIFLWADLLPSHFPDRDDAAERGEFYVAMTRAEDILAVLHSQPSPYVDELQRNIVSRDDEPDSLVRP